ncbi:carbonic anhydrase [Azospirillum sp. sgz301742]
MKNQNIRRRTLLGGLALGGLAACPICAATVRSALADTGQSAHPGGAPHWSYEGAGGPEHWGELTPEFRSCSLGLEQTPIDLNGAIRAQVGQFDIAFKPMPLRVLNNGHTIQVNCDAGSGTTISGTRYELVQFHFHHPSEHLLSGKAFDMECHFVHKAASGALAVVGTFITPGEANPALQPIWDAMPKQAGPEKAVASVSVDPNGLLPSNRAYFRYAGSLTTPPCSEGLTWTVFKEPVQASTEQIRQFAALFPNNARPAQSRNRRYLLEAL